MIGQLPLLIPKGGNSVMASRVATAPDELDYFPTPPWGGRVVAELVHRLDPAARSARDPGCGEGHLAHGLADHFPEVHCADIFDHRPSLPASGGFDLVDWRSPAAAALSPVDWIVGNPPFALGEEFIRLALDRARVGVAMLLRLQFLEGARRHELFYGAQPLTAAAVFAERLPMVKGRWDPDASSATAYGVFLWDKHAMRLSGGNAAPMLLPIPPGAKARLTRASEMRLFGPRTVAWYEREALAADAAANDNSGPAADKLRATALEYRLSGRRMAAHVEAAGGGLFGEAAA